jgi:hypothetical protein
VVTEYCCKRKAAEWRLMIGRRWSKVTLLVESKCSFVTSSVVVAGEGCVSFTNHFLCIFQVRMLLLDSSRFSTGVS